jgi:hypothetical protein
MILSSEIILLDLFYSSKLEKRFVSNQSHEESLFSGRIKASNWFRPSLSPAALLELMKDF